jgi:hypothetical protein
MDSLTCNLCQKQFKCEYLLNKHKNSTFKCNLSKDEIKIKQLEIRLKMLELESIKSKTTCKFCNSEYSNLFNLRRHIKESCKMKQKMKQQKQSLLNTLNSFNNMNTTTINSHNTTTNSHNIADSVVNSNNTTINLSFYGKENISHLTKQDFLNFTKNKFGGIIEMIKKIHCNKDHKENFNIYIEHPTSKYICVYNEDGWQDYPKSDFLEKLKTDKFNQLDDYIFSLKTDVSGNKTENELHKKYQAIFDEFRVTWIQSDDNKKETKDYLDKINCTISSIIKEVSKIKKATDK